MEMVLTQPLPFMETVRAEIEADEANITQQPNSYLSPFMETVRFEVELPKSKLEAVRTQNQRLHIELGNSERKEEFFRQKVQELRSQLETERADRDRCRTIWLKGKNCIGSGKKMKN
jgi:chromosome segregation ATPase